MKAEKLLKELMNGLETTETYNNCMNPDKSYKFSFVVSRKLAHEIFKLATEKGNKKSK